MIPQLSAINVLNKMLDSHDHDALLLIHTPSAITESKTMAEKLLKLLSNIHAENG